MTTSKTQIYYRNILLHNTYPQLFAFSVSKSLWHVLSVNSPSRCTHSNILLETLRWLPISQRIKFQMLYWPLKLFILENAHIWLILYPFLNHLALFDLSVLCSSRFLIFVVPLVGAPFLLQHQPYGTLYHFIFVLVRAFLLHTSSLKLVIFPLRYFNLIVVDFIILHHVWPGLTHVLFEHKLYLLTAFEWTS
jgi:hypothetical protein